jgi:uncharacterized membrane protein YhhN
MIKQKRYILKSTLPTAFYFLTGAILFVLSDSAIAINKFGHNFSGFSIVVMTTYLAAQYLIVTGYIRQYRSLAK